jgi:hypothetical protein
VSIAPRKSAWGRKLKVLDNPADAVTHDQPSRFFDRDQRIDSAATMTCHDLKHRHHIGTVRVWQIGAGR